MKTVPCKQDLNGEKNVPVLDTEIVHSEGVKVVVENATRANLYISRKTILRDSLNNSESENLISSNKNKLSNNLHHSKIDKHKLTPGTYLQKVLFSSVPNKFRSQSLPNSLENKIKYKSVSSDKIEDINEISVPLFKNDSLNNPLTGCWFKTWPERTVDKLTTTNACNSEEPASSNSMYNCSSKYSKVEKPFLICKNLNIGLNKTTGNKYDIVCPAENNESKTSLLPRKDLPSEHCNGAAYEDNKSIPLDQLLENFPLAYSPVTRQLHLISNSKNSSNCKLDNFRGPSAIGTDVRTNDEVIVNQEERSLCCKPISQNALPHSVGGLECDEGLTFKSVQYVSVEVSSFSSTVSSLSDNSPSTNEDSALGSLLDCGDTCSLVSLGSCSAFSEDSIGEKSRKKSLTGFFSRNVFNWKSISRSDENSRSGWKVFIKHSLPGSSHSSLSTDQYNESDSAPDSPCSVRSGSGKRVASSSALIQLARPDHLPAKKPEEDARHRQEYQQMVDAARKKEVKESKQRKKQQQDQLRIEEQLARATRIWSHEILPNWHHMHHSKKTRDLWWQGVPPCVRGRVWQLAIGNSLCLTRSLYDTCVHRAQDSLQSEKGDCCNGCSAEGDCAADSSERSMQQIQLDISRTFPHLCIFQKGGPYYDTLYCLLAAYVYYRPDVGYVQGMSFIAAVLILNMEPADAFVCFANLLNRPCHMAFFHLDQPLMQAYYSTYNELLKHNLPQLFNHFSSTALTPDLYLLDWIYTVFSKAMCLDMACRVWDVFLRDGDQFLFRAALGVLHLCQDTLLKMDFVHGSQFLTKLPDDLPADKLFCSISCIKMTVGKATFDEILSANAAN